MAAMLVLSIALLAPPAAAGAQPPAPAQPACQSFSRSSPSPPPLARAWFAHSTDERVVICPKAAAAGEAGDSLYLGEGAVSQHGAVCSYHSHGLTLIGSGTGARLERYERSEALSMAVAHGSECPQPHATAGAAPYVETYDVSTGAFLAIMHLWSTTAAGLGANPPTTGAAPMTPEARARLESVLTAERVRNAAVTRIVRLPGSLLRQRYGLFLTLPQDAASGFTLYVLYLDKSPRKPYQITSFAETN